MIEMEQMILCTEFISVLELIQMEQIILHTEFMLHSSEMFTVWKQDSLLVSYKKTAEEGDCRF